MENGGGQPAEGQLDAGILMIVSSTEEVLEEEARVADARIGALMIRDSHERSDSVRGQAEL